MSNLEIILIRTIITKVIERLLDNFETITQQFKNYYLTIYF